MGTIVNTSCCTWINTSGEVELELEKFRKIAQDISSPMSINDTVWFPVNIYIWLPSGISTWLRSRLQILTMIVIGFLLCVLVFKLLMLLLIHIFYRKSTSTKIMMTEWI